MDLNGEVAGKKINLSERVKLNVGGQFFQTTIATLVSHDGMLKNMFGSNLEIKRDSDEFHGKKTMRVLQSRKDGSVFIDRDGEYFSEILNFLRSSSISLSRPEKELEKILAEAEFYQIEQLICMLKESLSTPDRKEKGSETHQPLVFLNDFVQAGKARRKASKPVVYLEVGINYENAGAAVEHFLSAFKIYGDEYEFILDVCSNVTNPEWTIHQDGRGERFTRAVISSSTCHAMLEMFALNAQRRKSEKSSTN